MYRRFVERRMRNAFASIERRDVTTLLDGLAEDVHHRFAGDHPLGGERRTRAGVAAWFERLFRLYPELAFDVHRVAVVGPPWRMTVTVEWTARAVPASGDPYDNRGAHVLRVERGAVRHLHAYEDSQAVAKACARMFADGVAEAGAPPIRS
jgi:ketosteroid isomerase-like protein